jgi:lysophospholipase L1-like esterase
MGRRRAFRPAVLGLEDRLALSRVAGAAPPLRAAAGPSSPATTPTPVNDYYETTALHPSDWLALHDSYSATARQRGTNVIFLGDSLTFLWGGFGRTGVGSAAWDQDFAPLGAKDFGIFGDQTQNVLWRVLNGELAGRPKVVVLMIGINNLMQGQSPQETVAGIDAVVRSIGRESPRTRILLLGLLPAHSDPADPLRAAVRQVNALLPQQRLGPNVHFLDVGSVLLQPDGTIAPNLTIDTVHPSAEGYQRLADAIQGPLLDLLHGRPSPAGPR